ncbi:MAG: MerR family transcriptional regulator [Kiloniellaceae bacterium]|nr:MerR family transcriptional regulator [Kiloniellaceae bacterium]
MHDMTISRAAREAGVGVETIRFYERWGLIAQPCKPAGGGAREYDEETVARVRFVRQAQDIGFSLREIAELLSLRADLGADCSAVRARAMEKRDAVQAKLEQLARVRDALDTLIAFCPGSGAVRACTILEAIEKGAAADQSEAPSRSSNTASGKIAMKTTLLAIDGMHCDGCARTVEALLSRLPGVRKAEASFDERQARVLHDQESVSEVDLAEAIAKGGFTAKVESQ